MSISFVLSFLIGPLAPKADGLELFRQWRKSPSPELRVQSVRVLRGHGGRASRVALLSMLDDPHHAVRAATREELVRRPAAEAQDLLRDVAALKRARARIEGLRAILERGEDCAALATDRDGEVRARVLAMGRVEPEVAQAALKDKAPRVRAIALERLGDPEIALRFVRDRCEEPRIAAARVLEDEAGLGTLLADRSWRVRLAAVRAAERLRRAALIPALIGVLRQKPGRVRARAADALEQLTGAPFGEDRARWRQWWGARGPQYELGPPRKRSQKRHSVSVVTFRRIPVVSRRVAFVLDASRSMDKPAPGGGGKSRWELVVRDLGEVVRRLPCGSRFNVILFRTEVELWRPQLVKATAVAKRACGDWIAAAKPAGWTNLYDGLAAALADDDVDALYVLTDGVPSRGTETRRKAILDEIAFLNRFRLVQVNCVQAGGERGLSKAWRGFLEELAQAHDGVSVRE